MCSCTEAATLCKRFLAEAPNLEEQRVREILPWLAELQDGAALPYLLPLLVQATGPGSASKHPDRWVSAARSKEVSKMQTRRSL